jgi:hypothetical protein
MSILNAFKKRPTAYVGQGAAVIIQMDKAAPEIGDKDAKGYPFKGIVQFSTSPDIKRGDEITVNVRPEKPQNTVLGDLAQSKADRLLLLEAVRKSEDGSYVANWVHDGNRHIQPVVADLPTVHFKDPEDSNRNLSLSQDGRGWSSSRPKRQADGEYAYEKISFPDLQTKLKQVLADNGKFSVSQNVYGVGKAVAVTTPEELDAAAKSFEGSANGILLRTYIAGTTNPSLVSLKYAYADADTKAFNLADALVEDAATKRIGEAAAAGGEVAIEVIPIERMFYAGQNDRPSKSTKHNMARKMTETSEGAINFNRSFGAIQSQVLIRADVDGKAGGIVSRFVIDGQHGNVRNLKTANFDGSMLKKASHSEAASSETASETAAPGAKASETAGAATEFADGFGDDLPDDLPLGAGPGM